MDDSTGSDNQISSSRSSISNNEARTVEPTSAGSTGAQGFPGRASSTIIENFADATVHRNYGQRATLSVNYKPGNWDSVRAWILKAGSGWHQAETAEDPQNMNKFAAGSLGAVTAHRIKCVGTDKSNDLDHFAK